MQVAEHIDLIAFNTLALPARARYYARAETPADVHAAIAWAAERQLPLLPLGGGSNVVLRGEYPGLVLQIALRGKTLTRCGDHVEVRVAAGENWHDVVQWALHERAYGLENLTLIPGTAGAAPIQNIGAYGVELAQFLSAVRGIRIDDNHALELSAAQCELGYRDSVFKHALRGNFIVTEIVLHLRSQFVAAVDYPALREQLGAAPPDALRVEQAVRAIRQSKLPDPSRWPNAGSFFKNPVVTAERFAVLQQIYPDLPHYEVKDGAAVGGVKIPAAWLVERCGWKGRRLGAVGVHDRQALVLIHYGGGDADELLTLAEQIRSDVMRHFDIALEMEPGVYGG